MKELLQKGVKVRFVRDVSNQTGEYAPKNALGVVTFSHVMPHENMYFIEVGYQQVISSESDIEKVG